ncbi:uncharacterized protein C19orf47-like [Anopheles albimanus]|uniref:SAM domain-containing protein n=1 Tax=Anopheles albimanus TaxID=7167 RepID=A0A8W7K979_ANOAL|nr:uncharacterized protein C19orf47-like [Anopheles albimanus]XP_035781162.1 uncharacterized protein C19orf47-like [Anopheles albimanus]
MPNPTAASWVKFFTNADIPSQAAATYAHVFVENRIQMDMLMDLNKEYLREMGITTMGDIIAILRHAKKVSEQSAREKVLSLPETEASVPVATVSGTPNTVTVSNGKKLEKASSTRIVSSVGTPLTESKARRVLPEHEGKYKITLPSGSTARSKEILEKKLSIGKHKATDSDSERGEPSSSSARIAGTKRGSIFDRLNTDDDDGPPSTAVGFAKTQKIDSTAASGSSSSIFARLGGRERGEQRSSSGHHEAPSSSILKKSPSSTQRTALTDQRKVTPMEQKVILVKKIPAKATKLSSDEDDEPEDYRRSESYAGTESATGLKSVSFSAEDEVLEIAPRKKTIKSGAGGGSPGGRLHFNDRDVPVKQRLGGGAGTILSRGKLVTGSTTIHRGARLVDHGGPKALHGTKKVTSMKHYVGGGKLSPVSRATMKLDTVVHGRKQPVHTRLSLGSARSGSDAQQLVKRVERFSLDSKLSRVDKGNGSSNASVFNRLGYNRK